MKIGFDGKRAFQNKTGLGNYIRSLLAILAEYYPGHYYILFAARQTGLFDVSTLPHAEVIKPTGIFYKKFSALWRRKGMVKDIEASGVDIFHGVSNELPRGISKCRVKSVVTVHDLIFERYPETYNFDERYVHRWKIKQACREAGAVIAISEQTKNDLVSYYKVPAEKIHVCYQSCNPIFQRTVSAAEKKIVKERYRLPDRYFLFVSSITARKNLITIIKAMVLLKDKMNMPLVVIGNGDKEKKEAKQMAAANGINDRLIMLNEMPVSKEPAFTTAADFPAIYQQGLALIYPSIFEGFGAPLLEAMWSGLPVISSNTSSLPEVAGNAALYFSPYDVEALAGYMLRIAGDEALQNELKAKGAKQAAQFSAVKHAESIMNVYKSVL